MLAFELSSAVCLGVLPYSSVMEINLASYTQALEKAGAERRALYTLSAHAPEIPRNSILPCRPTRLNLSNATSAILFVSYL